MVVRVAKQINILRMPKWGSWMPSYGGFQGQNKAHGRIPIQIYSNRLRSTMPANIEIKSKYDEERLMAIKDLLGLRVEDLVQVDTFFKTNQGRLKLREEVVNGHNNSTLIGYHRTNDSGPSRSDFTKTQVLNPGEMKEILSGTLGVGGVVKKERQLYLLTEPSTGLTSRVHIDLVEGLGRFLELEVILESDSKESDGIKFAQKLTEEFKITEADLLSEAYVDMLNKKTSQ